MKLIITIDTEEDNWSDYSRNANKTENIKRIPELQGIFDDFNVKPTYLINYPVATDDYAKQVLSGILKEGRCEIGTHCHPWNTPPFEEEINRTNTMLCNLPAGLQYKKLNTLHRTIKNNFDIEPMVFRAGRWGFSLEVARNIYKLGYRIDTSVTPYTDWSDYDGPDFSDIPANSYRINMDGIAGGPKDGYLLEVPATVGFLQRNFALSNRIHRALSARPINKARLVGIFFRLRILNKVWLSPEMSDGRDMIRLTERFMEDYDLINMTFHSPSLQRGLTSFVQTREDEKTFSQRIRDFLKYTCDAGIESIRLSECLGLHG